MQQAASTNIDAQCYSSRTYTVHDLADVTDAEFTECGIPLEKGEWLRSQARAVRGGGSGGGGYPLDVEVVMVGVPAPQQWRSEKGIELMGPKQFGFDFEYIPIEKLQAGKNK